MEGEVSTGECVREESDVFGIAGQKTLNRSGVGWGWSRFRSRSRIAKELPPDPIGDHEISADGHGEDREVLVMCVPCEGV